MAAVERAAGQRARPAEGGGITPRLAEILAAMVEAVLDAENALRATRGTIPTRRPRAPRDRRPTTAKRGTREVQP
jgi:hypothetical protein